MAEEGSKTSTDRRINGSSLKCGEEEANVELLQIQRTYKEKKNMSNTLQAVEQLVSTPNVAQSKTGVIKPVSRKSWMEAQLTDRPNVTKKLLKAEYRAIQGKFFRAAGMSVGAVIGDPNCVVTSFRVKKNDDGQVTGYSANWKVANAEESGSKAKEENAELKRQNDDLKRRLAALEQKQS